MEKYTQASGKKKINESKSMLLLVFDNIPINKLQKLKTTFSITY